MIMAGEDRTGRGGDHERTQQQGFFAHDGEGARPFIAVDTFHRRLEGAVLAREPVPDSARDGMRKAHRGERCADYVEPAAGYA